MLISYLCYKISFYNIIKLWTVFILNVKFLKISCKTKFSFDFKRVFVLSKFKFKTTALENKFFMHRLKYGRVSVRSKKI